MPRFSVIVPAYKVQAYLAECLDSVLTQTCTDLELIAVDDCSPDACGALFDEYAARDPRVLVLRLPHNQGVGAARNLGLSRATGDYVIFLNGDDALAPGALQSISDRLKATGSPDVLLFGVRQVHWAGEHAEEGPGGTDHPPVGRTTLDVFQLADHPSLLVPAPAATNQAWSREFIEAEGLRFPPGWYADTAWTHPALIAAESIAVLDRRCLLRRQRRRGSVGSTPSSRHLDVLNQYERVLDRVSARPDADRWRPLLHQQLTSRLVELAAPGSPLPAAARAELFRQARAHYARHRPQPAATAAAVFVPDRLRSLLLRWGARRTYRTLSVLGTALRGLNRGATAFGRAAGTALLRLHYRLQRLLPLRPGLAVFRAYGGGGYACNPAAIEAKVRELAPRVRTAWICGRAQAATVPPGTAVLTPGSPAYWTALARARYLVDNGPLPEGLLKRPGQVVLQTMRGTPLKRVGLDLVDRPTVAPDPEVLTKLLQDADRWDHLLSANRHSSLVWEKALPSGYTALAYGYPRNDVFHRAGSAEVAEIRERLGVPPGAVAVLYAPTHRDYRGSRPDLLDLERVLRELGPRFVLLNRTHRAYGGTPAGLDHPRLVEASGHPSIEELCLASDALVTDYSSLMFDYAVLDRPMVVHADDWEAYEATRGTYFDLRTCPPGAVARTEDELIDIFTTGHWQGSRSAQLRAAFRARFCQYDDGQAAERVVRRVFLDQREDLPAVVPLSDRRPAPATHRATTAAVPAPSGFRGFGAVSLD
ncbi:CDP-glycerol glycerophosphotransferase family protein [Streptomyces sp. NPDC006879]|uniref:bifunctional glycosyltransferase/CDP-glycerol:glycerophosphate glycerophosphotransferase n=1 Tax=Streptomyces sp. NPDC006879 TaxID=3364767 RepID=UPI0036B84C7C